MSKFCPITNSKVVYLVCQECEDRVCERPRVAILPKKTEQVKRETAVNNRMSEPIEEACTGTCASCSTCCNKTGVQTITTLNKTISATRCKIYNRLLISENSVSENGCEYHNKDMSQEKICMNCKSFLGGGDWGLACAKHYHRLPESLTEACEDFDRNSN